MLPNLSKTAAVAALFVGMASASHAVTWSISGPGVIDTTVNADGVTTATYNLRPSGYSLRTWDVTAVYDGSSAMTYDWSFTGLHSWYAASASLTTINPSGPATSLVSGSTYGGFAFDGQTVFDLDAGDTFGFRIQGGHFDSANLLLGSLEIAPVPLPATAALALMGLAGLGLAGRKKADA